MSKFGPDLRQVINDRRNNRERDEFVTVQQRHETIRAIAVKKMEHEEEASGHSARSRSERDASPKSTTSLSSRMNYSSSVQSAFSMPMKNVAYPPMADWCPIPLGRDEPNLIGRSEIYVRPPNGSIDCPACDGDHPMFRCETMRHPDMRERWYVALRVGVCLFCLHVGHSSFSCNRIGRCRRCKTRHNSVLCPTLPKNRLVFRTIKGAQTSANQNRQFVI